MVFFPGNSTEIEAEPEQVERPGSSSPGKEASTGFGGPSKSGAEPVLEMKHCRAGYSWGCVSVTVQ